MLQRALLAALHGVALGAEWQVGHICVNNMAPFDLHWHAHDLTGGGASVDSGNTPEGVSSCIDLSAMEGIADGHLVLARVDAVLGVTKDVATRVIFKQGSAATAQYTCRGTTLSYDCTLDGVQAEWEVSRICVKNSAPFVMQWKALDLSTSMVSESTSNVLEGKATCIDLKDVPGIQAGTHVSGEVQVHLGKTHDLATPVVYNPQSPFTASYTCRGSTLIYMCTLDEYDSCDAQENKTAATDWALRTLIDRAEFSGRWQNWFQSVRTCDPLFFPRNDAELAQYLQYAHKKGYKVRITGATHSSAGLVDDESAPGSTRTIVLSLGRYELSDAAWCADGDFCLDTHNKFVRTNAGKSWLDLYAFMRPSGWFIPTQTAGYFFSIAGSLLGSVHGGAYGKTFLHGYVRRMRVMLWDGSVQVIEGGDLYAWKSSYGLLGILTAVEMDVVHRNTFEMYTTTSEYQYWNEDHFWQFVAEDAEANLDLSFFPGSSSYNMTKDGIYGEYFLDFVTDTSGDAKFRTQGVLWKTPKDPKYNKSESEMRKEYAAKVNDIGTMREDGADKIDLVNNFLSWSGLEKITNSPEVTNLLMKFNYLGQDAFVAEQSQSVNDGYWVGGAPNVYIAAYFVPIENSFAAFDYARSMARARQYGKNEACFRFNDPVEYRFVEVTDDSLLQNVPPGSYVVSEILGFVDAAPAGDSWQRAYAEIECEWTSKLGGIPHMMKLHSFDEDVDGNMKALQACKACELIPENKKKAFEEVRQRYDPHNLFASGFAYNVLIQPCPAECKTASQRQCPPKGVPDCGTTLV